MSDWLNTGIAVILSVYCIVIVLNYYREYRKQKETKAIFDTLALINAKYREINSILSNEEIKVESLSPHIEERYNFITRSIYEFYSTRIFKKDHVNTFQDLEKLKKFLAMLNELRDNIEIDLVHEQVSK